MSSLLHDLTKHRKAAKQHSATQQIFSEPLTAQQSALARCTPDGIVQVNAYAGTGKTSSLCALASQNPGKNCLYLEGVQNFV